MAALELAFKNDFLYFYLCRISIGHHFPKPSFHNGFLVDSALPQIVLFHLEHFVLLTSGTYLWLHEVVLWSETEPSSVKVERASLLRYKNSITVTSAILISKVQLCPTSSEMIALSFIK